MTVGTAIVGFIRNNYRREQTTRSYKRYALSHCNVYDYGTISIWTIGCYVTEVKRNVIYSKISW